MKYFLTILFIYSTVIQLVAQVVEPIHFWDMNGREDVETIYKSADSKPVFQAGFEGLSIALDEKMNALELTNSIGFYDGFTLSFWFKPENISNQQSIFRQSRFAQKTGKAERHIEVFIQNNFAMVRSEKRERKVCNLTSLSQNDGWYWLTFSGDAYGFKVFLQGEQIFESIDGTMFREMGNKKDQFIIGEGASNFIGKIDEVQVFDEVLDQETIEEIFNNYQQKKALQNKAIDQPLAVDSLIEKVAALPVFKLEKSFKNRANKSPACTVISNSGYVNLDIWDYYKREIDGEEISIYLNEESELVAKNTRLDKKRKKQSFKIKLPESEVSYLIFYAENVGSFFSAATIGAFIEGMDIPVKMTANRDSNAVIKILNHSRAVRQKKEALPLVKLSDLVIEKAVFQMKFIPVSPEGIFEDLIIIPENRGQVQHLKLKEDSQQLSFELLPDEAEKYTIRSRNTDKEAPFSARLIITESGKQLSNQVLRFNEEKYEISLKRKPNIQKVESGKRLVEIPKTNQKLSEITLVLSDHDQPDGDQIKLWYESEVLIENLTLSDKPFQKKITLNSSKIHRFSIETIDFGTSPEPINTPKVQVIANGKIVDEFVFWLRKNGGVSTGEIEIRVD